MVACFNWQFPNDMMLNIFSHAFLPSVYLLRRGVYLSFTHFLIGLFPYHLVLRVLRLVGIVLLYQMCLLSVFSPNLWLVCSFSSHCLSQSSF